MSKLPDLLLFDQQLSEEELAIQHSLKEDRFFQTLKHIILLLEDQLLIL